MATQEARKIADVLGGEKTLGTKPLTTRELEECERAGFPTAVVDELIARSVVMPSEVYGWIVAKRTFARRVRNRQRLNIEESNRIARVARLYALAADTFGDEGRARHWLRKPLRQFGGRSAMDMMRTETGAHQVEDLLGKIAHGLAA